MAHQLINVPDAMIERDEWLRNRPHKCMKYRATAQKVVKIAMFIILAVLSIVSLQKQTGVCPEK